MAENILKNWIVKNLLAAAFVTVAFLLAAIVGLRFITHHNKTIEVPDFTNLTIQEAQLLADKSHVKLDVTDSIYVKRMRRGAIYRQNPKPGSHVKDGRRIILTINAVNAKRVNMPNLVGYSMRQARAELVSKGLKLGKLIYVQDIATNNVLKQLRGNKEIEPGKQIESDTVIDLVVGLSDLDKETLMPYILGMKNMTAVDALQSSSLNVGKMVFDKTVKDYSDSLNAVVYKQEPEYSPETLEMGTEIKLYLTTDLRKVPEKPVFEENLEDEEKSK